MKSVFNMEVRELRIGNWVKTCTPNMKIMIPYFFAQVQSVSIFHDISFLHTPQVEGFEIHIKHIEPIPITPEILEKAGFVKISGTGWDKYTLLGIDLSVYLDGYATIHRYDEDAVKFPCKYVHQLQNLYYALTGEELLINLAP